MAAKGNRRGLDLITRFLDEQDIGYEVVEHRRTATAAAAARAAGISPDATAKTIALRDGENLLLAVIPASQRLDLDKVRRVLGASDALRFASEEEMRSELDLFDVGAIAPLADLARATEVVDERLLEPETIMFSGGDHTHGVLVDPNDLLQVTQPKVDDVCVE
jgi:Ala-tRNA(Pro) deacylase